VEQSITGNGNSATVGCLPCIPARDVSRRERRMTSKDDIGNHRVLQFTLARGPTCHAAKANQSTSLLRCGHVKRSNQNRKSGNGPAAMTSVDTLTSRQRSASAARVASAWPAY